MQKYKNQPFAILGVNVDQDLATLQRSEKEQQLSWPSIWDGKTHANSRAYQVEGLPTILLIDATGRLVKTYLGAPSPKVLEADVERLLREVTIVE